jgi:hypothetical protein
MTDVEQIFWILAGLYAFASSYWIRPEAVVFASAFGRRHRLRSGSRAALRNDSGCLVVLNLLPCGTSGLGQAWPFSVSPLGVSSAVPATPAPDPHRHGDGRFVAYADLTTVAAEGVTVLVNGARLLKVSSANYAGIVARFIRTLADLPPDDRAAAIDAAIARSLDAAEAAGRAKSARKETRLVRWLGTLLFAFAFGSLGAVAFAGAHLPPWRCLSMYFGLVAVIALEYYLSHRSLRPAEVAERRKSTLIALASPADAMQAGARLFRLHLELYHPLALAAALSPRDQFLDYARRVVRDLRHPTPTRCTAAGEEPRHTQEWFGKRLTAAVEAFLARQGVDVESLVRAPRPETPACRAYCPRCEGQYERAGGKCSTCDVPLQMLGEPDCPVLAERQGHPESVNR